MTGFYSDTSIILAFLISKWTEDAAYIAYMLKTAHYLFNLAVYLTHVCQYATMVCVLACTYIDGSCFVFFFVLFLLVGDNAE